MQTSITINVSDLPELLKLSKREVYALAYMHGITGAYNRPPAVERAADAVAMADALIAALALNQ